MASISKITIGGVTYDIKDATARGYSRLVGVTNIAISDGGVQVPTDLYGEKATVSSINVGDMVIYGNLEFIWAPAPTDGKTVDASGHPTTAHWHEFGAVQATSTASNKTGITAKLNSGAVSGTSVKINSGGAHTHDVSASGDYTPAGSISAVPTTGHTHSVTAKGSVSITTATPTSSQTATYTPAGKVSASKGTLAGASHSHTYDKTTSITSAAGTADSNTFAALTGVTTGSSAVSVSGSVTVPTVSASEVTSSLISSNDTVTAVNASVSGETLTLSEVTATKTAYSNVKSSKTGVGSTSASFTATSGTTKFLTSASGNMGYFKLTPNTTSTSTGGSGVTITGDPSALFTGTGVMINGSFTGTAVTSGGPSATAAPTFTGKPATISVSGTAASAGAHDHTNNVTQGSVGTGITITDPGHTHTINQQA